MNPTRLLFMLLPIIGILVDYTVGYPALTWIVDSLPVTIIPIGLLILFTSAVLVSVELLFGASDERILKNVGWAIVSIVPLFSIAEGFNKYTESILLEMPQSDVYRILITQGALVILTSCVHILIIVKAKYILSLYSGSLENPVEVEVVNSEELELKEYLDEINGREESSDLATVQFQENFNGVEE